MSTPAPMEVTYPKVQRTAAQTRLITIRIILISVILFFNSTSTTYLYSFLPDMMVDFGLAKSKTHSGSYAAWMASGFFFGRFISASLWGAFIDKYGRKTGLLIVLGLVSVFTLAFGFSSTYPYALVIRTLTGFVNGLSIVAKTLSTEICPDDMKAWSISATNTIWALGMTIGPFIGSYFFRSFESLPYLAPSLAVAMLGLFLMVVSYIYFEETLDTTKAYSKKEDTALLTGEQVSDFSQLTKSQQLKYILSIPNIKYLILIFGTNTFYAAVIGELVPFWVAGSPEDGGLGFNYKDISHIYLYLTIPQLLLQIVLYPYLQKYKGDFWLLSAGHWAHIPMFFFIPWASNLFATDSRTEQKMWIIFWMFVRNLASFMNFSSLQRFTNDAISGDKRGKLNGFQVTFSSCLQVAGPMLGGWLLSFSMKHHTFWPFNHHFVFVLMCFITLCIIRVIYKLVFNDPEKTKLKGERDMHGRKRMGSTDY